MKAKKAGKDPAPASVSSNGIKKNKKKKDKSLALKLSAGNGLTEAVKTAAATDTTPLLPKKNKNKKKNKKNLEQPSETTANDLQMKNGNTKSQAPAEDSAIAPTSDSHKGKAAVRKDKIRAKHAQPDRELPFSPETNKEHEERTIFVGNVSTKTTRKSLSRFFSKYGKVEAVRLRCAAVPTPGTTKRQAVIMNNFHDKRTSLSAYIRFTEKAMVEEALKANGVELDQKHLHVDRSQGSQDRNTKLAVFVGNLAFEAEEEALRTHFAGCGQIESVRIVRDRKMASGKGFGYINFESEDAVEIALQMDGQVFMHRQLRVQRCTKQGKKGMRPKLKTGAKKGLSFMKNKPSSNKSTKKQNTFSGRKMMETKKFKKMKAKSKFTKEDRKKKAIAHKLAGGKPKTTP